MAIGVNWAEIWGPVWANVWNQTPPVEVPDVVGQDQSSATVDLEADGFTVAVVTAHSSTVPIGLVISQEPEGGQLAGAGSQVTITVSLGEAPVSGGGHYAPRRKRRDDPLEERIEEQQRGASELRNQIDAAVRGPEPQAQPSTPDEPSAPRVEARRPVPRPDPTAPLRAQLARVERALERYRTVEVERQKRITELESFIEVESARVLSALEVELTREEARIKKALRKTLQ